MSEENLEIDKLAKDVIKLLSYTQDYLFDIVALYHFIQKKGLLQEFLTDREVEEKAKKLLEEACDEELEKAGQEYALYKEKLKAKK